LIKKVTPLYRDRPHAGEMLAERLKSYSRENLVLLVIPNGGVPVGFAIFKRFHRVNPTVGFNLIIVRKIPIPYNTEAGFGAITIDGTIILNEPLVARISLTEPQIKKAASNVLEDMKARLRTYGIETQKFELKDKVVILIDDGIASGFTMIAAVKSIQKYHPQKIVIAVPTAPRSSVERVAPLVDEIVCPDIQNTFSFAVANAYQKWYDIEVEEVRAILYEINALKNRGREF
jgi:putative phosphoribosyl transferase